MFKCKDDAPPRAGECGAVMRNGHCRGGGAGGGKESGLNFFFGNGGSRMRERMRDSGRFYTGIVERSNLYNVLKLAHCAFFPHWSPAGAS